MAQLKILQVCPKPPLPAIDGGCLASYELSRLILSGQHNLQVLSLATEKHPFLKEVIESDYLSDTNFKAVTINTAITAFGVISNLFKKKSLHESRFRSGKFSELLKQHLKKHIGH